MWCAYKCMQCWVQCGTKLQAVMEPAPPRRAVDKPTVHMSHNNKQTPATLDNRAHGNRTTW